MATVYLAQDLKHDRQVAIKVLRPELAAILGAERFLAEIKTTANLQHPHILPLFDSGEAGGQLFYVMPFIEGESLRDRLTREKQLPVADAVRIAGEVAGALDYAHRHGVIHRDIKPENILLHDGRALVADFGIALAASKAGGSRMTETGMSLGTPQYMAPEQAMGEREITPRADLYALGVTTYEMLAGEPPFTGPTAQAIVARMMTAEPESLTEQRRTVPPHVEAAVFTALAKLPADRFATAADFVRALEGSVPSAGRPAVRRPASPVAASRVALLAGVGILVAGAAFLAGRALGRSREALTPPSRLSLLAGEVSLGGTTLDRQLTITPAGDAVVFVGIRPDGRQGLYFQRLDAPEPTEIPGGQSLHAPAVSRDGRWLIGTSGTAAYRLPLQGGTPAVLPMRVATSANGTWSPDGTYWFNDLFLSGSGQLVGTDSVRSMPGEQGRSLRTFQVLEDGRTAIGAHTPGGTLNGPGVLVDLVTGERTRLVDGPVLFAQYVEGELLTVAPNGTLSATPFDLAKRRTTGPPTEIATGLALSGAGIVQVAVADNGTIAYIPESPSVLVEVDRDGRRRVLHQANQNLHAPMYSPDGRRVSFDLAGKEERDVRVLRLDDGTVTRATFVKDGHDAVWSADGQYLVFLSQKDGALGLYRARPGNTAPPESLLVGGALTYSGAWLPGGEVLLSTANNLRGESAGDLVLVRNGGRGPVEPLVASPFQEAYPALSPDGRWVAYTSDQSGRQEVYVRRVDGEGETVQVSTDGGTEPVWGADGRELFYRSLPAGGVDMMAASLRFVPAPGVITRRTLFPMGDVIAAAPHRNYDRSPDGRRFVMVQRAPATRIVVLQHLASLLARGRREGAAEAATP